MKIKLKKYLNKKSIISNINYKNLLILLVFIFIYYFIKNYISFGDKIVYPITLIVTFLHEFGHSFFALISGGSVEGVEINSDGSGYAITAGGIRDLVLIGGYIGSAIFGNILLYISFKKPKISEKIIYFLSFLMIFVAIFWFNSIFSSFILFILAGLLFILAKYTRFDNYILQFLGISSILYIISDFNVGPSSDLAKFSTFLPTSVWMIIWLVIVILITGINLKLIFKK